MESDKCVMFQALKWTERAQSFDDDCQKIVDSFKRIITCPNRALLYDIFPYISDMRGVISMLRSYVKWLGKAGVHTSATVADQASDDKSSPTPISGESAASSAPSWLDFRSLRALSNRLQVLRLSE